MDRDFCFFRALVGGDSDSSGNVCGQIDREVCGNKIGDGVKEALKDFDFVETFRFRAAPREAMLQNPSLGAFRKVAIEISVNACFGFHYECLRVRRKNTYGVRRVLVK